VVTAGLVPDARIYRPNGFERKGFLDRKRYFWIEQESREPFHVAAQP
jgi:hypothetical protein